MKNLTINSKAVTDTMDLMAGFELLNINEQKEVLQLVIDTLGNYLKPQQKHDNKEPKKNILSAYLCVSNVRNACKLALLNTWCNTYAHQVINKNLEDALTSLIIDVKIKEPKKVIFKIID